MQPPKGSKSLKRARARPGGRLHPSRKRQARMDAEPKDKAGKGSAQSEPRTSYQGSQVEPRTRRAGPRREGKGATRQGDGSDRAQRKVQGQRADRTQGQDPEGGREGHDTSWEVLREPKRHNVSEGRRGWCTPERSTRSAFRAAAHIASSFPSRSSPADSTTVPPT